jgi:transcription elongation factor Elf1
MFVANLHCAKCGYKSQTFVDSHSTRCKSFTVICANAQTRLPRVAHVPDTPDLGDDKDIEAAAVKPGEIAVRTRPGANEQLELTCPKCGERTLMKCVQGLE